MKWQRLGIGALCQLMVLAVAGSVWAEPPLQVTVSILPQKYFVEHIGGGRVQVQVMVEPGVDPHVYDPKPQQMVALSQSKIYFAIGVPFEDAWLPRFAATNPKMRIVHTEEGIAKIPVADDGHGEAHEEAGDPHVWLSPPLVMLQARHIFEALLREDPENAATYAANYSTFLSEVARLDFDLSQIFLPAAGKEFMVFHPSWTYFADAYGLKQVSVELEDREPKAAELQHLITHAKEHGIKVIFVQPQFSTTSARVISESIGGQVVTADPLAEDWAKNLREMANQVKNALQ